MEIILNPVVLALLGVIAGLLVCTAVLMIALPFFAAAGIFVNRPTTERSGIHFFTIVGPGEVKIIVRGKKPVRMVMNTAGKRFARDNSKNDPSYWELVDSDFSEDPTDQIHWMFRWWAKIVYEATGAVFTGIYPLQRVYEYDLQRTVIDRSEKEGRDLLTQSNLVLTVKSDLSDHLRTRQFLFPVHVTKADTNGKIPVDIIGVAEMEVTNPHKAAFGTDRWDNAMTNLITDVVTNETKQMSLDSALTGTSSEDVSRISSAVTRITDDEKFSGIDIKAFRILEVNPALDRAGLLAIQAEELAKQQAKATRLEGKARADNLRELNQANEEGGKHALASLEAEALVRAAEAAGKGGGTVILMPSGNKSVDPTQTAILAELQRQNRNNPRRN